ncbi:MAG: tetratricopeptide repeat protein [Candidatus Eiseniibacteriota bacterium]
MKRPRAMDVTNASLHRHASALARAAVLGFALGLVLALSGCGMSFFGHSLGGGPAEPTARRTAASKPARHNKSSRGVKTDADPRAEMAAHPQDPYWPYTIANQCLARDSVAAAEALLRSALERDPGYAPALSSLSKIWFDSGRHEEAIRMLSAALDSPDRYDDETRQLLMAALALHQDALGRPDLARAALAGMPKPDLKQSRSALVYVRLRGEAPDSAGDLAERALHGDSNNPVHLNNFGITRLRAGDLDGANQAFIDAIQRDPSLPGPYYNLAILEKFYRFDDVAAARWFHAYWKLSHSDPDSLLGLFHADGTGPAARQEN